MQAVIRENEIEIIPERFEKIYFHWIDNLRDWCISRQIWWGHRIPVWYRHDTDGKEETYVGVQPPTDQSEGWNEWEQDPDTLDTWFSSALWTWSTLIDQDLARDYNLSLEEILSSEQRLPSLSSDLCYGDWLGYPILLGRPHDSEHHVYDRPGTVQEGISARHGPGCRWQEDEQDLAPRASSTRLDVIPKYGTDALRMALIMGVSPGNDQNWGWGKIEANRNFCNKLWNIARYIEDLIGDENQGGEVVAQYCC